MGEHCNLLAISKTNALFEHHHTILYPTSGNHGMPPGSLTAIYSVSYGPMTTEQRRGASERAEHEARFIMGTPAIAFSIDSGSGHVNDSAVDPTGETLLFASIIAPTSARVYACGIPARYRSITTFI
jgi:hypothetical protein